MSPAPSCELEKVSHLFPLPLRHPALLCAVLLQASSHCSVFPPLQLLRPSCPRFVYSLSSVSSPSLRSSCPQFPRSRFSLVCFFTFHQHVLVKHIREKKWKTHRHIFFTGVKLISETCRLSTLSSRTVFCHISQLNRRSFTLWKKNSSSKLLCPFSLFLVSHLPPNFPSSRLPDCCVTSPKWCNLHKLNSP